MATTPLFRIRTEWTGLAGGSGLTTTFFDESTFGVQQTIDKMADFWSSLDSVINTEATWSVAGDADIIDPTTGNIIAVESGTAVSGGGTDISATLSAGTQGLLNLRTGVYAGGREIRGKLYVPAPAIDHLDEGVPDQDYRDALTTAWATFSATVVHPPVVYSRTHGQWEGAASAQPSNYFARLTTRQR